MRGLVLITLAACSVLCGCGAKYERGADTVIQKGLSNPDSYYAKSYKLLWQGKSDDSKDAYIVEVVFNAQNGFGATIQVCKDAIFTINGDRVTWNRGAGAQDCDHADGFDETTQRLWRELLVPPGWIGKWI